MMKEILKESDVRIFRSAGVVVVLFVLVMITTLELSARPKFAKASGQKCATCHVSAKGGGVLRPMGKAFAENKRVWPEDRSRWTNPGTTGRQHFRFGIGIVHGVAGVLWVIVIVTMLPVFAGGKVSFRIANIAIPILIATGFVLTLLRFTNLKLLPLMFTGRVVLVKIALSAGLMAWAVIQPIEKDGGYLASAKLRVVSHVGVALTVAAMMFIVRALE